MDKLKEKFASKATPMGEQTRKMLKEHGEFVLGQYTVEQVYSGMKGMIGMITETSKLDAEEGIRFRGYSIPELREKLPVSKEGPEPLPEGIFYLLLTGEIPTLEDVININNEWMKRANVPKHVFDMLDALPISTHPMTQFSAAVMALQTESFKYKGWSVEGEYYLRWLSNFKGTGVEAVPNQFDHGFQLQMTKMLMPKILQFYTGYSQVYGNNGNPYDFRFGTNWFPYKNKVVRWNTEVLYVHKSPVGYTSVTYPVGGRGWVFNTTMELAF